MTFLLDTIALTSALFAAWLWFRASSFTLRRVSKAEEINTLDLNRIVTAINRTQKLNRRAALATAVSALAIAVKFGNEMLGRS